jgi:hypothetical protein
MAPSSQNGYKIRPDAQLGRALILSKKLRERMPLLQIGIPIFELFAWIANTLGAWM